MLNAITQSAPMVSLKFLWLLSEDAMIAIHGLERCRLGCQCKLVKDAVSPHQLQQADTLMAATGLAAAAHPRAHSAELQWQHLQSQYRELEHLQSAHEAGNHSPLRRLLAKKAAAAAAEDDDEDSYEDDMDLDEPMAAGTNSPLSTFTLC